MLLPKTKKQLSRKSLVSKADRIFSKYIRLRDVVFSGGYCKCISCGKLVHWKDADAGHYVNRAEMVLRYDERNVNAQCRFCNRFREGNMIGYTQGLIRIHGPQIIDLLQACKASHYKHSHFELQEICNLYSRKLEALK